MTQSPTPAEKVAILRRAVMGGAFFTSVIGVLMILRVIPADPAIGYALLAFVVIEVLIWFLIVEKLIESKLK